VFEAIKKSIFAVKNALEIKEIPNYIPNELLRQLSIELSSKKAGQANNVSTAFVFNAQCEREQPKRDFQSFTAIGINKIFYKGRKIFPPDFYSVFQPFKNQQSYLGRK